MKKILVAYASVSGSTGEVAEAIGETLSDYGANVQVCHVRDVSGVVEYNAVVLGSSIIIGRWLPAALQFLDTFRPALEHMPVAWFTTCLAMVNDTEDSRRRVMAYLKPVLERVPDIKPVGLGLFAGSLGVAQSLPVTSVVKAPKGDYRSWETISAWTVEIAPILLGETQKPDQPVISRNAALTYNGNTADGFKPRPNSDKIDPSGFDWDNMEEANLSGVNLIGVDLSNVELNRADLSHAILNGANLSRAGLRGANLSNADLNWADLRGADLRNANLSQANIHFADLSEANLGHVNLTNARYNNHTSWPDNFSAQELGGRFEMYP